MSVGQWNKVVTTNCEKVNKRRSIDLDALRNVYKIFCCKHWGQRSWTTIAFSANSFNHIIARSRDLKKGCSVSVDEST